MDMQTQALRALTREIPMNDFGFPTGIYRVDLLPWDEYEGESSNDSIVARLPPPPGGYDDTEDDADADADADDTSPFELLSDSTIAIERKEYRVAGFLGRSLHNAFVPLYYDEGFPALDTGLPFWTRLEFEPVEAFQAFQQYLQMSLGRAASHGGDPEDGYDGKEATGTRSISRLVAEATGRGSDNDINHVVQIFQAYYHQYYWGLRAHAYDLFRVAQYRKQQELRSIETQTDHYQVLRRLRHRLQMYMESEEEFWDLMSPKAAIDMLKTLTSLERISAGLPASGPASDAAQAGGGTPFEIHFRTVAQTNKGSGEGRTFDETGEILDAALEDEASTRILQQLVIRSGG